MTAMDILEALGQTQEEMLCSCEESMGAESREKKAEKNRLHRLPLSKAAGRLRLGAGFLAAAAAVLLLVYVGGSGYISRSFDSTSSGRTGSFSTQESAETTMDTAEEETVEEEMAAEENGTAQMEESTLEDMETAETTESVETTESAVLPTLQLGQVYLPTFDTSLLTEAEYAEMTELVKLVQEEIVDALSVEDMETLPVYRLAMTDDVTEASGEESDQTGGTDSENPEASHVSLIKKLGNYPVITQSEAEELLWQGYYLSPAAFSMEDTDSAEVANVELCYLISAETMIYMPYYQFTVAVEQDMVYVCCVPAVSQKYLTGRLSEGVAE